MDNHQNQPPRKSPRLPEGAISSTSPRTPPKENLKGLRRRPYQATRKRRRFRPMAVVVLIMLACWGIWQLLISQVDLAELNGEPETPQVALKKIKTDALPESPTPIMTDPVPNCQYLPDEGAPFPKMVMLEAATYRLVEVENPVDLRPFLDTEKAEEITLDKPIMIQEGEVTTGQFKQYADFVDGIADAKQREQLQVRLGLHWNHQGPENQSVKGISWEAAQDFIAWLKQNTGCHFRLPTRQEWSAAVLHQYRAEGADPDEARPIRNLLQGIREWSSTPCDNGYMMLGEDSWVALGNRHKPSCMPPMISVAGFRLVRSPNPDELAKADSAVRHGPTM